MAANCITIEACTFIIVFFLTLNSLICNQFLFGENYLDLYQVDP